MLFSDDIFPNAEGGRAVKARTQALTRQVQIALTTLEPSTLFILITNALDALLIVWPEGPDCVRFRLGWTLIDTSGQCYSAWPPDPNCECDWVAPDPLTLSHRLTALDAGTFYHEILPMFSEYPALDSLPPSSASDGYRWMESLAQWIATFPHDPAAPPRTDTSPRLTTAQIASGCPIPLGDCGDAWYLTAVGDPTDVVDHRPYADHGRTPVGLCTDAPLLVLYPERGAVDWPTLLDPAPLTAGFLFSGAPVWILALAPPDRARLVAQPFITLADLVALTRSS